MEAVKCVFLIIFCISVSSKADNPGSSGLGCMSYPCANAQTCVNINNKKGYMCCDYISNRYVNSTGHLCFPCDTLPCGKYGTCNVDRTDPHGYLCQCPDGTAGHSCGEQKPITSTHNPTTTSSFVGCGSFPCAKDAICVTVIDTRRYVCCDKTDRGYVNSTGHLCFPCTTKPCGPNGICQNDMASVYGYICKCADGSSGQSCPDCAKNEIQCEITRKCIPNSYKCDDYLDCGEDDVTDELNCGEEGCRSDQTLCKKNRRCIPKTWVCDGNLNCGGTDFSDEDANCTGTCNSQQFLCKSGKCISEYELCDGQNNCKDNSDEKPEICVPRACTGTDFSCGKGHCIPATQVCDDKINCRNGEDENSLMCANFDCNDVTKFRCANRNCVKKINICDGYYGCYDYSEERTDFCYAWRGTFGNVPKWLRITSNRTVFN